MNTLRKALMRLTEKAVEAASREPQGPWRLRYHLQPPVGWLNDPNGLSFYNGQCHVFYQYAPFDVHGGIKFWGHYRSRDFISWEHLPVMLYSDEPFDVHGAYSGSALPEKDGLYMYYTGNVKYDGGDYDYVLDGREQNTILAISRDGIHLDEKHLLMTNQDYPEDMTRHVRDPKVFALDGKYYMVLGARTRQDQGVVLVYESDDRFNWYHINTLRSNEPLGYMWECPDLFELDGQWFLMISPQGIQQAVPGYENKYCSGCLPLEGDFRGDCRLGAFQPLDFGFDFYAPQSFSRAHEGNTRRLLIGWMGMPDADYTNPTVDYGYQMALTQIRELRRSGMQLTMMPIKELEKLRCETITYRFETRLDQIVPETADIEFELEADESFELSVAGLSFRIADGMAVLDVHKGGYGRTTRGVPATAVTRLRLLLDTSSAEIFLGDGERVFTTRWYPEEESRLMKVIGSGTMHLHELRPFAFIYYGR